MIDKHILADLEEKYADKKTDLMKCCHYNVQNP